MHGVIEDSHAPGIDHRFARKAGVGRVVVDAILGLWLVGSVVDSVLDLDGRLALWRFGLGQLRLALWRFGLGRLRLGVCLQHVLSYNRTNDRTNDRTNECKLNVVCTGNSVITKPSSSFTLTSSSSLALANIQVALCICVGCARSLLIVKLVGVQGAVGCEVC